MTARTDSRALTAPRWRMPWRLLAIGGWFALSAVLLLQPVTIALLAMPHDWMIWRHVPDHWAAGTLYAGDPEGLFVFSPVAGAIMAALVPLGFAFWYALHLAVLPLLREWRLALLTLFSVPFLVDLQIGSTVTWTFVAGVIALRGGRAGALAYLALFVLMPRPIALPLAAWLLWKQPATRWPCVAMVTGTVAFALATGYLDDWTGRLLWSAGGQYGELHNYSPTRLMGSLWLPIGIALAAWLTWRGRVGLAGLALTPYLLPPYFLLLLWELTSPLAFLDGPERGPVRPPRTAQPLRRHGWR